MRAPVHQVLPMPVFRKDHRVDLLDNVLLALCLIPLLMLLLFRRFALLCLHLNRKVKLEEMLPRVLVQRVFPTPMLRSGLGILRATALPRTLKLLVKFQRVVDVDPHHFVHAGVHINQAVTPQEEALIANRGWRPCALQGVHRKRQPLNRPMLQARMRKS